ncbi:ABC transporter permease [Hypericibacter adhaerens]|jgi:drug/metabolite transporter (DMT)-like permease|uniref:ABC transporter permease n=1 Tax=Hypericibacter adhaerens TaxID=2602016 RepID=A0A5J6N1N9_9PROT|nr:DMT family transporter [Hypericibacter adhaerens]QEX23858.1 ABC transporter permease [Hypericibacter adhaerens]
MTAPAATATVTHAPWRRLAVPLLLLLVMGACWGGSFSLLHVARFDGASGFGLAFWEGFGSGVPLLLLLVLLRERFPLDLHSLRFYAVSGLTGITIPASTLFVAALHLPTGIVAMSNALVPMVTYAIALAIRLERFASLRALGLVAGLVGVLLVLLPEASLPEPGMAHWALLCFSAAIAYGVQNVYVARDTPPGMSALAMSAGTLLGGGILVLPLIVATDGFVSLLPPWQPAHYAIMGMMAINSSCTVGFLWLIRTAGAVFTSQTAYLVVLFGMLWGMLFFGDRHSGWIWAALLLMVAGVLLVSLRQRKAP